MRHFTTDYVWHGIYDYQDASCHTETVGTFILGKGEFIDVCAFGTWSSIRI